jgi:hypothetical protein
MNASAERGDNGDAPRLPHFVRYRDLHAAGIVASWQQLFNLIDDYGFPSGVLISPNTRVWNIADVEQWLAGRPSERKAIAPRRVTTNKFNEAVA